MDAKVHALFGVTAPTGQPVEDVVKILRGLLESAEAGEVSAVAVCWAAPDRSLYNDWANGIMPTMFLLAAADRLHHCLNVAMDPSE